MKVIMPGSYDPVTLGHLEMIEEAAKKYDEVFVVAFINPDKNYMFSIEDRVKMLMLATDHIDNVLVSYSTGFVVDYMREHGIEKIVKGYRDAGDIEYERKQAEYNFKHGGYETELVQCRDEMKNISSTLARKAIECGQPLDKFLPESVIEFIKRH